MAQSLACLNAASAGVKLEGGLAAQGAVSTRSLNGKSNSVSMRTKAGIVASISSHEVDEDAMPSSSKRSMLSLLTGPVDYTARAKSQESPEKASFESDFGFGARAVASGVAAFGLAALLQLAPAFAPPAAFASEQTILSAGPPRGGYVYDDAGVLNRVTKSELKGILSDLEAKDGYHIDFVTLRKLLVKADAFEFADQVLEKWYPTIEEGNKRGIVVLVTTQKEGAVTGGPAFVEATGEAVLEAIAAENLPVLATDEKYNEAFSSTAKRLVNAIRGLPDIEGPKFQENKRESNFKTREETAEKRGQFSIVVGGLLVIAFVVPMAQYYAYVSKK